MTVQAYVDDSGSTDGPVFVLGGFIANVEQWCAFSVDWNAALNQPPTANYFKMREAAWLNGQFDKRRGWTEEKRNERVIQLAGIIRKHAIVRIHAQIRHADFIQVIRDRRVPVRRFAVDSPYILLAENLILRVALNSSLLGIGEPCDFVFDEQQGISTELLKWWPSFRACIERSRDQKLIKMVGARPKFEDEKDFMPLQGADLYAWHLRRYVHSSASLDGTRAVTLSILNTIPAIQVNYDRKEVDRLRSMLDNAGLAFVAKHPALPLLHFPAGKLARKKARRDPRIPEI